ncbi:hypothetical protein KCP70_22990 [Salmonella enterica subsp. enterica]|nr:hypothetical protein KCP70_22990 [Salmonella enterica subsp. enterica]
MVRTSGVSWVTSVLTMKFVASGAEAVNRLLSFEPGLHATFDAVLTFSVCIGDWRLVRLNDDGVLWSGPAIGPSLK